MGYRSYWPILPVVVSLVYVLSLRTFYSPVDSRLYWPIVPVILALAYGFLIPKLRKLKETGDQKSNLQFMLFRGVHGWAVRDSCRSLRPVRLLDSMPSIPPMVAHSTTCFF